MCCLGYPNDFTLIEVLMLENQFQQYLRYDVKG